MLNISNRLRRAASLVLLAVLASTTPRAQAVPRDPEATVVDELVVTARVGGPAWWRVSLGDGAVWILGVPPGLPKGFAWDTKGLDMRLAGARGVITPAIGKANLLDIPALLHLRAMMKSKTPLEDTLPTDLRERFLAGAHALGRDPSRYDHWNAFYAAALMLDDFRKTSGLDIFAPMPAITRAVRAHGLKPAPAATYKALPVIRLGVAQLDREVEQSCLAEALDEIAGGRERQVRAAEGWNRGEIGLALTAAVGFDHCLNMLPEGAFLSRKSMADEASAIGTALAQRGAVVAVMPLRQLIAEDGVLEQLKAKGYSIRTPDR